MCIRDRYQRRVRVWISMAKRYCAKSIDCVRFDIDPELCKQRISTRENHPTIAKGDRNSTDPIVDRFVSWLQPPLLVEGFQNIFTISTTQDFDNLVSYFNGNPDVQQSNNINIHDGSYSSAVQLVAAAPPTAS
eukprot:TRINITY_DN255_c0_g6_i2.p2 TRINITY_DN255_c0_g6~~TRINITY_DN255_c0_g6_i2.p2  ORF type:complete len:133 (+),score=27.32 TRINITY_DN255_c0_g6_i2:53-451(+)